MRCTPVLWPVLVVTLFGCLPEESKPPMPTTGGVPDLKQCLNLCVESEGPFFHGGCLQDCETRAEKMNVDGERCPQFCGQLGQKRDRRVRALCLVRCGQDGDLDGVVDVLDRCPQSGETEVRSTYERPQVDRHGCPQSDDPRPPELTPAPPVWTCEGDA